MGLILLGYAFLSKTKRTSIFNFSGIFQYHLIIPRQCFLIPAYSQGDERLGTIYSFFEIVPFGYFFLSATLFLIGIYIAPAVVEKEVTFLLWYPRKMRRFMEKLLARKLPIVFIFLLIFTLNNLSLFSSFIAGFIVIGPFLSAFLTGLNVAIVSYEMMGWQGVWQILVNPVAWLEFPAAWLSFAMGIKLAVVTLSGGWNSAVQEFELLLPYYLKLVVLLLFVAGILETALIRIMERFQPPDDHDNNNTSS